MSQAPNGFAPTTAFEMVLPRPVDAVWLAFRDPALIRRWYGWEFDGLDEEIRTIDPSFFFFMCGMAARQR